MDAFLQHRVFGEYDWVSPYSTRTPERYPYSHSEFYVWREFEPGDETVESYYTDRMRQWKPEKYDAATHGRMKNWGSIPKTKADAQRVVRSYFGPDFKCVGIIQSMNVGNGYPLGVFCVRRTKSTLSEQSS